MNFKENDLLLERYRLVKLIGKGGFSVVWQAVDEITNVELAIKIYAPDKGLDEKGVKQFTKEYRLTQPLNHPNLLKATHYDVIPELNAPFLIMPFCKNGSLTASLDDGETVSEKNLAKLMVEIGSGLDYLHHQNPPIIHQDIKPDNILIGNDGQYMLTDFGISNKMRSTLRKSTVGESALTVAYAPPEKYTNKGITEASDIFSFGIMLFECLTDEVPWGGDGGVMLLKGAHLPELPSEFPDRLNKVIIACLEVEPEKRPTAKQMQEVGAFFQKNGYWPKAEDFIPLLAAGGEEAAKPEEPKSKGRKTEIISEEQRKAQVGKAEPGIPTTAGAASGDIKDPDEDKKSSKAWIYAVAAFVVIGLVIGAFFMFGGPSSSEEPDEPLMADSTQTNKDSLLAADTTNQLLASNDTMDLETKPEVEKPEEESKNETTNKPNNPTTPSNMPSAADLAKQGIAQYEAGNYSQAMNLFNQASNLGSGQASWYLGYMYREGKGVTKNYTQAKSFYLKSGQQGYADGYNSYGYMYDVGIGVTTNEKTAFEYYKKAANMGLDLAEFNVGLFLDEGRGGNVQDWDAAFTWYKKSADKGYKVAQRLVGEFYLFGVGGATKDKTEAFKWFRKAAANGDNTSTTYLKVINEMSGNKSLYEIENADGDKMWLRPEATDLEAQAFIRRGTEFGYRVFYRLGKSSTIQIFPMYKEEREKRNIADMVDFTDYSSCERLTEESGYHDVTISYKGGGVRTIGYYYIVGFVQDEDLVLKVPAAICWLP